MAIMGFGLGALVFGPTMTALFAVTSIPTTFLILAGIDLLVMGSAALAFGANQPAPATSTGVYDATPAPQTLRFWYLWLMLFLNVTCGIALISAAAPMLQEQVGLTATAATGVVGLIGLFNGGGRLGWSALSDRIGRSNVWTTFFILGMFLFLVMSVTTTSWLFQAALLLAITCYGGGFACMPSFIADLFGVERLPRIQGLVLTAWSAAGIVGPQTAAQLRQSTGSYAASLQIFAGLLAIGLVVVILLRVEIARRATASTIAAV